MTDIKVVLGSTTARVSPPDNTIVTVRPDSSQAVKIGGPQAAVIAYAPEIAAVVKTSVRPSPAVSLGTPGPIGPPGEQGPPGGAQSTDELAEGAINLYFTAARAQDEIAAHVAQPHPHAQYPQMSAAVTIDGDVLEYDGSAANWAPTASPRKLYLDGGNF